MATYRYNSTLTENSMVLLCLICGNHEYWHGSILVIDPLVINNCTLNPDGTLKELGNIWLDQPIEVELYECGACRQIEHDINRHDATIVYVRKRDLPTILWKHTRIDGTWSEEELPKEERNQETGNEIIMDKL